MTSTYEDLIQARKRGEPVTASQLAKVRQVEDLAELERSVDAEKAREDMARAQAIAVAAATEAVCLWQEDRDDALQSLTAAVAEAADIAVVAVGRAYAPVSAARAALKAAEVDSYTSRGLIDPNRPATTTIVANKLREVAEAIERTSLVTSL